MVIKKVIQIEGFEELQDIEEQVVEALDEMEVPDEFEGTVRITVEYVGDK